MASVSSESHEVSTLSLHAVSLSRLTSPSPQSSPRIDYFSSLPNELLDNIFEYLYDQTPPPLPLSKRLRPWFEKHFYRKFSFSSFDSLAEFADTLFESPRIAQYVLVLRLEEEAASDEESSDNSYNQVQRLLTLLPRLIPRLPHLVELDLPYAPRQLIPAAGPLPTPQALTRLRYLAISLELDWDECVHLDRLAQFGSLPCLERVKFYQWDEEHFKCHRSESTVLPHVTTLDIRGSPPCQASIQALTCLCPSLIHLELHDSDSSSFSDCISHLPATLRSLSLFTSDHYDIDFSLSHFSQLRYLRFGSPFSAADIVSTLSDLRSLVHLHLEKGGYGIGRVKDLLPRLPSLKVVTLDFDKGTRGGRISRPSAVNFNAESEVRRCSIRSMGEEWVRPGEEDGKRFDAAGMRSLLKLAERTGITVDGTALSALQTLEDFYIEANNRAVVFAASTADVWWLRLYQYAGLKDGTVVPYFETESLDFERVEIVEHELPEKSWYVLSLRNKERSEG